MPLWGFDGSSTMQAEGKSSDCILKPVALYPDASRKDAFIVLSEVMHPDGTPHSTNMRATVAGRSGSLVRIRAGVFPLQGRASAWVPRRKAIPDPQGPYYCGVGYKYMGEPRADHRRRASGAVPGRRHQPRRHQRRSGQGPVGVPDLRQGLAQGRGRHVDGPLPDDASLREVRSGRGVALQADQGRLERLGHAHQLLDQAHARSGRQGVLRGADEGLRQEHGRSTSRSTARTTICA